MISWMSGPPHGLKLPGVGYIYLGDSHSDGPKLDQGPHRRAAVKFGHYQLRVYHEPG